jgi:hypothetical protein
MENKSKTDKKQGKSLIYDNIISFSYIWIPRQFKVFNSNDFKKAYLKNNDMPENYNVFGAVFNNLHKKGFIFHYGYTNSKTKESKGCLIRTWISKEYKQKQALNASNKSNLKLFDDI